MCAFAHIFIQFKANERDMIWTVDSAACNWDKCSIGRKCLRARYEENWRLNPKAFSWQPFHRENWYLSIVNVRIKSIFMRIITSRWNLWWSPLKLNGIYSNFNERKNRFERFSFHSLQSKTLLFSMLAYCVYAHNTTYYQSQIWILDLAKRTIAIDLMAHLMCLPLLVGISVSVLSDTVHRW